jgi:hypothetical protein
MARRVQAGLRMAIVGSIIVSVSIIGSIRTTLLLGKRS